MENECILKNKSVEFAIRIINLYKYLVETKKEYILSKQILRSGTSIGANISEAEFAQSNADFISKLSIALKENNETQYWLLLLKSTNYIDETEYNSINEDCIEIMKMLISSIKTSKLKTLK